MKSVFAGSGMPPLLAKVRAVEATLRRRYGGDGGLDRVARILAVDPGSITGVCVLWVSRKTGKVLAWAETLITHNEDQQVFDLLELLELLSAQGMVDVVIEDFTVHSVRKEKTFLSPVRIGRKFEFGILERRLNGQYFYRVSSWMVPPSEMSGMDDTRLKALGYFTPGPDHRRDATRHGLLHLKRVRSFLQKYRGLNGPGKLPSKGRAKWLETVDELGHWPVKSFLWEPKVAQKTAAAGAVSVTIEAR